MERIIQYINDGAGTAHQAFKNTCSNTIRHFYWPTLKRDVQMYVSSFQRVQKIPEVGAKLACRFLANGSLRPRRRLSYL